MPIIDLLPLDGSGIDLSRPPHEVRWRKLTNVVFKDGSLVPRPGFSAFAGIMAVDLGFLPVEPAPIIGLVELYNPGSSTTGRESWTPETEILRPDGSSNIVAGWSGDHGDIDETPPDAVATISTSTSGAQKGITFANPSATYGTVFGVLFKGRARNSLRGGSSRLKFYQRIGTTNFAIPDGEVDIYAFEEQESSNWQDFVVPLYLMLDDNTKILDSDLDNLHLVAEFVGGSSGIAEFAVPEGDGNYTDWDDATAGGAATFSDYDLVPFEDYDNNGAISTTADERQSFTVSLDGTYDTVTAVQLFAWITGAAGAEHQVEWFFRTGGVNYQISTETFGLYGPTGSYQVILSSATNPATSSAWTSANITGGEFGIRNVNGTTITLQSCALLVEGTTTGQTVHIDTISAEVMGATTTLPNAGGALVARIMSSNQSHIRVDDDYGPIPQIANVTNSVPMDDSPSVMPLDWAVLYGQVYIVNGIDSTRRYPNGSSVFEALATNNGAGSAPLTGRTVASFAERILYGWTKDNTTVTPERVAYSQQFNGGVHNHVSAGDFDIIDTPGGIVKILALNESIAFCGKELGIYSLRRTGNSAFPIIVDPIDYETRCIAMKSVQRVVTKDGRPLILFLGWNPSVGYNVFSFDGSSVVPVGDPISPALRDDANHEMLRFAVSGIDPDNGTYWLLFAEGTDVLCESGYAMNIRSGAWSRVTLPWTVHSAGNWTQAPSTTPRDVLTIGGQLRLVLGREDNVPMVPNGLNFDSMHTQEDFPIYPNVHGIQGSTAGIRKKFFSCEMETGDIALPAIAADMQLAPLRLHVEYTNKGPFRVLVKSSIDGGVNYSSTSTYYLGELPANDERYHAILDVGPQNEHFTRYNITVVPEETEGAELPGTWQIDKMYFQYEVTGIDGA